MFLKSCAHRRKDLIRTTILRANGVNTADIQINTRSQKSLSAPAEAPSQAAHRCNLPDSCLYAISGNAPYGESAAPAYARRQPQRQAQDAAAPMTDLSPGSSGFARPAYDDRRCSRQNSPTPSRDDSPA